MTTRPGASGVPRWSSLGWVSGGLYLLWTRPGNDRITGLFRLMWTEGRDLRYLA